ncbi:acyl--CoA ligase [Pseudomonas sp. JQ170]|uniref:class I adenylate-forming enzyme family protein n=1 Tax=unclassified Pseudomonas TaxID=196821 RepID=UPI00264EB64D|nr:MULTISPECIES: class I adenylate-forming enzyme family protein [unclassified Pseudomonas]MDN7142471.1 acyl--CoA ligase [Pseudomonas sp. JQ170]WRO73970.1 class I adenylate-forming enzyme family protein [Pseudomonas sp. 170C]
MKASEVLLQDVLETRNGLHPDKAAIIYADETYTYAQLDEASARLAAGLQVNGLRRQERVVLCLGNRVETVCAFWGVLKAGGVVVNVGLETHADSLDYIVRDAEASVLITTSEKMTSLRADTAQLSHLKLIVLLDGEAGSTQVQTFEGLLGQGAGVPLPSGNLDLDLAAIIYTSGSTGMPKGVMLTHRNMLAALSSLHTYLGYNETDNVLCSLPLSFDYGLYQMIMAMSAGATLVLEKEFTWPIFLIKKIRQYQVTVIPFVPTMLVLLHEYARKREAIFPDVRMVTNTGAALKAPHIAQMKALFPQAQIYSMYGLTECKRCTYLPPEDIDSKPGSVGIAIPNTELWLVDEDDQLIDEPHQVGQLVIRGATVMAGYWRNPAATALKLKPGRYPGESVLYTGDYCSLDEDGYLYFQGRMDQMIKSRGMKVSPSEVEGYLYAIEGIEAAAVVGVDHAAVGEGLWAFVTLAQGAQLTVAQVLERCRQGLDAHKVPLSITIESSLPRTANGKFDLQQLHRMACNTQLAVAG